MAQVLGAGLGAEAFRAALKIPNLLQNLLGEGVLSASFIPSYGQLLADGRRDDARRLAGAVAGFLLVVVGILGLIGDRRRGGHHADRGGRLPAGLGQVRADGAARADPHPGGSASWCCRRVPRRAQHAPALLPVLRRAGAVERRDDRRARRRGAGRAGRARDLATALAWGATVGGAVQLPSSCRPCGGGPRPAADPRPRRARRKRSCGRSARWSVRAASARLSAYLDLVLARFLASSAVASLGYAQVLYLLPISLFAMSDGRGGAARARDVGQPDRETLRGRVDAGLARMAWYVVPGMRPTSWWARSRGGASARRTFDPETVQVGRP